jgi:hypothetical protein
MRHRGEAARVLHVVSSSPIIVRGPRGYKAGSTSDVMLFNCIEGYMSISDTGGSNRRGSSSIGSDRR